MLSAYSCHSHPSNRPLGRWLAAGILLVIATTAAAQAQGVPPQGMPSQGVPSQGVLSQGVPPASFPSFTDDAPLAPLNLDGGAPIRGSLSLVAQPPLPEGPGGRPLVPDQEARPTDIGGPRGGETPRLPSGEDLERVRKDPLIVPLGEKFFLGPNPEVGRIREVFVDRQGLISNPIVDRNGQVAWAIGQKLGLVGVTIQGKDLKIKTYYVRIVPNIELLQELLRRQFPEVNLRVMSAGDRSLFVEGVVDAPEQVIPVVKFLEKVVPEGGSLINAIRVTGVMQVQLEVCIARVNRTALRAMGTNFLQSGDRGFFGNTTGSLLGVPAINARGGEVSGGGKVFRNFVGETGEAPTSAVLREAANVFFGVTNQRSTLIGAIEALEQNGMAKILATPTLVTLNGRPADFLVGGEVPLPILGIAGSTTIPDIKYKAFGTRLTFVPVILGEGKIRVELVPEVSRPTGDTIFVNGTVLPRFETQRLRATVDLENGQTLALGGLLQVEEEAQVQKVPWLGDIPYAGALFRRIRYEKREVELLVLVTPRLMAPLKGCQQPDALPGQESREPTSHELYLRGRIEVPRKPNDHAASPPPGLLPAPDLSMQAPVFPIAPPPPNEPVFELPPATEVAPLPRSTPALIGPNPRFGSPSVIPPGTIAPPASSPPSSGPR